MVFTKDDKILIKSLRELKGYSSRRFLKEFPTKNWTRRGLDYFLAKIDRSGTADHVAGAGRPRTGRTSGNIAIVEDMVLSQEDAPCTHRTVRQISLESGIHRSSVHRIVKKELQLKCLKKSNSQELTAANKQARVTRARQLLHKYRSDMVNFIFFTDEKLFTVAAPTNSQNDRFYVRPGTIKKDVSASRLLRTRPTFSKSVMVSVGVSKLGCTELHFIEPGVKVNGAYYRDNLLAQKLLPDMRRISQDQFFVFQQDGAPAHRARDTVSFLERETPDFIPPTLWPPNSPDLNPVDYSIWSVLQEKVYRSRIANVDELKTRLIDEWAHFDQSIVDGAIGQWRRRLRACARANGANFEHQF
jgi:DDE superfamily endonuclease